MRVLVILTALVASSLAPLGSTTSVAAAAATGARPTVRLVGAPRTIEAGNLITFAPRITGHVRGGTTVELQERRARGWRALTDNYRLHQVGSHLQVVPRTRGLHAYRAVLRHFNSPAYAVASAPVRVRVTAPAHPRLTSQWGGVTYAPVVDVAVRLNRWIAKAPTLTLQQHRSGGWTTVATRTGSRSGRAWWLRFQYSVKEPGPFRVVGSGPGWHVTEPVPGGSVITDAGDLSIDGPGTTLQPGSSPRSSRLTFEATAHDKVVLIADGAEFRIVDSEGRLVDTTVEGDIAWPELPVTGRYTLDVASDTRAPTVRLARPRVTTATVDGSAIVIPPVPDVRVPRLVTFEAAAGELINGEMPAGCSISPWGWHGGARTTASIETSRPSTTPFVARSTGIHTMRVTCPTTDAVELRLERVRVVDAPTTGEPVAFSATRYELVAFRFTTDIDDAMVTVARQSTGRLAYTWVTPVWEQLPEYVGVQRGNLSGRLPEAGVHLLLVQPYDADEPSSTISLTQEPWTSG